VRWLGRNLGNLFLAFGLAVVVWVAAVVAADPSEETVYPRQIPLEVIGQDPQLLQLNSIASSVRLTINAPQSIWNRLLEDQDLIRTWIDLSGLGAGEHIVEVKAQLLATPARVINIEPREVQVLLEAQRTQDFEVDVSITGDPALGYRLGNPVVEPQLVSISGPESLVNQVAQIGGSVDISGANALLQRTLLLEAFDSAGVPVEGLNITPATVSVRLPVNLLGGYRNVVVRVATSGEPAEGYWLTNISITPPNVTVFSTNPQLVNELPGYVPTNPIDLTGMSDDVDVRASLELPEGVTLVGEESVLVRLSIAAREGVLPITLPLEAIGLPPDLQASFLPGAVDVTLVGPLPILNNLKPAEIRISVNLNGLEPGSYLIQPVVDLLPNEVEVVDIQPVSVQVTIVLPPTPTPTGTQPTPTATAPGATPTLNPTATPTTGPTVTPTP